MNTINEQGLAGNRSVFLAPGYGVVLGLYLGLVVGLRINPEILDHCREWVYASLILSFAIVLHANRNLSTRIAWTAYGLCCVTHAGVATACDRFAIFRTPDAGTRSLIIFGFFVLAGFVAQGIGFAVRRHLLPPQDVAGRLVARLLPWLPLLVLLAMTLHTAEHHIAYGDIETQRNQCGEENDHLRAAAISLAAQGRAVRVEDGDLIAIAALYQEAFSSNERIEALLVFENRGQATVMIRAPGTFAAFFTVQDASGRKLPSMRPPKWAVEDRSGPGIAVPPAGHAGMFVALRPYYSLEKPGVYDLRLTWRGRESESLKLTVR